MSTQRRNIENSCIYHIYNRSIDNRVIFESKNDFGWFLDRILYYRDKYNIKIIAFALLPTHYHLVLQEPTSGVGIVKFISCLQNSYAKHFNYLRGRKGNLFESRYNSKFVYDDYYLLILIKYVNYNSVKHGLVSKVNKWDFSSYFDYNTGVGDLVDIGYIHKYRYSYEKVSIKVIDDHPWG